MAGAGLFAARSLSASRLLEADGEVPVDVIRAAALVERATVIDMLGLLTLDWQRLFTWQRDPAAFSDADFRRLVASGVSVFHPAVEPNAREPHAAALRWIGNWNSLLKGQPGYFLPVLSAADLDRARSERRIGVLIGFQNSDHFRHPDDVPLFHGLGQRVSQLTYNERNRLGSGCRDPQDQGLTELGCEMVAAMNRVGIAVDVSHCSERTTLEAIERSTRPVLVTHANCSALTPHPRNKSDRVIRALARRGGVMGITTVRAFVGGSGRAGTLDGVLDHFAHVAELVGVDHVGIGSDCDLDPRDPATGRVKEAYDIRGLRHSRRPYDLAAGLLRRGFQEAEVEQVLGGNFRRALGQIWAPA
jgi:membrane dipeptidase